MVKQTYNTPLEVQGGKDEYLALIHGLDTR
jgi:hypothetical protein